MADDVFRLAAATPDAPREGADAEAILSAIRGWRQIKGLNQNRTASGVAAAAGIEPACRAVGPGTYRDVGNMGWQVARRSRISSCSGICSASQIANGPLPGRLCFRVPPTAIARRRAG
jgi:hypothetical protein